MFTVNIFKFYCLVTAFECLNVLNATIQYRGNTKDATNSNFCYYEELELLVPVNGSISPTDYEDYCVHVSCRSDYVLMIKHCDRITLRKGCMMTPYDYTKEYPDCCYRVICY